MMIEMIQMMMMMMMMMSTSLDGISSLHLHMRIFQVSLNTVPFTGPLSNMPCFFRNLFRMYINEFLLK